MALKALAPRQHLGEASLLEGAEERVARDPRPAEGGAAEAAQEAGHLGWSAQGRRLLRAELAEGRHVEAGGEWWAGLRPRQDLARALQAVGAVAARRAPHLPEVTDQRVH